MELSSHDGQRGAARNFFGRLLGARREMEEGMKERGEVGGAAKVLRFFAGANAEAPRTAEPVS